MREDAENDQRREDLVRERLANDDPSKWETYEEMMDRHGLDPDSDESNPTGGGKPTVTGCREFPPDPPS